MSLCAAQRKLPKLSPLPLAPSNASSSCTPSRPPSLRSRAPSIIQTMNDSMLQGVDIQLKILQTHSSLVTNFLHHSQRTTRKRTCFVLCSLSSSLTDGLALLPCFRLHESRTVVASSIAAGTLRQFPRTSARRAIVPSTCARGEDSGFHPACSGHLSPISRR